MKKTRTKTEYREVPYVECDRCNVEGRYDAHNERSVPDGWSRLTGDFSDDRRSRFQDRTPEWQAAYETAKWFCPSCVALAGRLLMQHNAKPVQEARKPEPQRNHINPWNKFEAE